MEVKKYQTLLNLQNAQFTKIEHEDALVAAIYLITLADGKQLILKILQLPRHYLREAHFLTYFAGKLPVPKIIETVAPSLDIDGAVLMECLPGKVLKIADYGVELAFELGQLLGHIHQHHTSGYGELIDQKTLGPSARDFFGLKFEEIISECSHHLPVSLIDQCKRYYHAHLHLLDSVDGPCIVHRDFRPGNVIVNEGKIQGIIDWASAGAGFAEEDFCCMEHGEWAIDSSTKKPFLEGYASVRRVPNYQEIMPFLRLCKALNIIGFLVKEGTWKKNQSRLYQMNRQYVEDFFE